MRSENHPIQERFDIPVDMVSIADEVYHIFFLFISSVRCDYAIMDCIKTDKALMRSENHPIQERFDIPVDMVSIGNISYQLLEDELDIV